MYYWVDKKILVDVRLRPPLPTGAAPGGCPLWPAPRLTRLCGAPRAGSPYYDLARLTPAGQLYAYHGQAPGKAGYAALAPAGGVGRGQERA